MNDGATVDPLARLSAQQRAINDAVDRLAEAASSALNRDERGGRSTRASQLLDELPARLHDVEDQLFAALIESMAGSDPVCLRELSAALTNERSALERRWQMLRAHLEQADSQALTAFAAAWRAHLARWHAELLPMAERLLDDAALVAIGCALDEMADTPAATVSDAPGATTFAQRRSP